jgi:hypothetical protein
MGWGRLLEQLYNVFVYDKTVGIIIGASLINDTAERDLRNADREKMFFRIISRSVFFSNWEIFSNKNLAPFFPHSYSSILPISIGRDLIIFNLGTVSVCDGTSGEFHFHPDDEYHRHTYRNRREA